jgi:hypothetical protein
MQGIGIEPVARARGQQHSLLAICIGSVRRCPPGAAIEQAQRLVPLAFLAAVGQRRRARPWQMRRQFRCLFGIVPRRLVGPLPLGFQIQPAQAQKPGLGILGHGLEQLARLVIAAFDQGRLHIEQMNQRLLIGAQQTSGALVHLARRHGIAGTGGQQARSTAPDSRGRACWPGNNG